MTEKQEQEYNEAKENGRVGTPNRDTSAQITKSYSLKDVWFLMPTIISVLGSGLILYIGGLPLWITLGSFIICAISVLFGAMLLMSSHEFNDPAEILGGLVSYFYNRIRLPLTDAFTALLRFHGLKTPFDDGTVEMSDGSLFAIRRMSGRTTQNLDQDEYDRISAKFGGNIDEGIRNFPFKLFSQTWPEDVDGRAQEMEDLAYSGVLDRVKGYLGELMRAEHEWYTDVDAPASNAREMRDYVVVKVRPKDIPSYTVEDDGEGPVEDSADEPSTKRSRVFRGLARLGSMFPFGIPYSKFMSFNLLGGSSDGPSYAVRKEMQTELRSRLKDIDNHLLAGIDGCEVEPVSADETTAVLMSYWTGVQIDPDDDFESWFNRDRADESWPDSSQFSAEPEDDPSLMESAKNVLKSGVPTVEDRFRPSASELALSPTHFEQRKGYMEIDNQYVAGFWIADHKTAVKSGFAKALYQLDGVDYSVTWDVTPVDKQAAISEAEQAMLNSGSKAKNSAQVKGRQFVSDRKAYEDIIDLLENTSAQAWDITGYVVLRAGPRAGEEYMAREENEHKDFDTLEEAQMSALEDAEDRLNSVITSSSFNGALVRSQRWQKEILESASPNRENVYNEVLRKKAPGKIGEYIDILLGEEENSGPKQRRVLGGWLGALFPPCQTTIDEEGGFRWGRDTETGLPFATNPAKRHTGGHMLSMGVTRSGKTYGGSQASIEWFAEGFLSQLKQYMSDHPNRIFIAADTQKGFLAPCHLVGGKHIPISGSTHLNPFDARPPSNPHEEDDPFQQAVDFVTEFIKRILRSQEVDPSEYHTIIQRGVAENYTQAGMTRRDFTLPEGQSMPDMTTALEIWKEMQSDPLSYSHSEEETPETKTKAQRVGELLGYLSEFRIGGKYENLMGQTTFSLSGNDTSEGPEFYYLDFSSMTGSKDAEKSAFLWLGTNFATQKSRESNDEMVFLGDEAHLMLYSDEQVEMILRWLREWARNNSWVWLMTQNLSEILVENSETSKGMKQALIDQFAQIQVYNYPTTDEDALRLIFSNEKLVKDAQDSLTPALSKQGYSECFMMVRDNDKPGWHRVKVEACPMMDHALNYDPKSEVDFDTYMQYFLHTDALAPVERLVATDEELEKEPEITDRGGLANLYAQQQRAKEAESAGPKRDSSGRFAEQEADD